MPVRALLRAALVETIPPPYNQIQLKIFYPALEATTEQHRATGILPFDATFAPAPIVIFLAGVNCSAHTYEWLATALAAEGIVTVISHWMAENLQGRISESPGIDIAALKDYGSRPTSSSLPTILGVADSLKNDATLGGMLNHENLIFGGHSAGGTMALQNARRDFFPYVKAAFAYCANPLATMALVGNPNAPLPTDCPTLMIGATLDGIGDHHNKQFGNPDESGAAYIERLFLNTGYQDSVLAIFEGANHHTICYPPDTSIGRIFMDTPTSADEACLREEISHLIIQFIQGKVERPEHAVIWNVL